MTTNNIFTLIQMMQGAANPQQFLMNFLNEQVGQNPFFVNLLNLAKQGNTKEIENVARNFCAQRGKDFDKEFNSFKRSMGL
jgi:hypothetical protein